MNNSTRVQIPLSDETIAEMIAYPMRLAEGFRTAADFWRDRTEHMERDAKRRHREARIYCVLFFVLLFIMAIHASIGCSSPQEPHPPQSVHSVAIDGPTEIITVPHSLLFTFDRATLGEPAPGWMSTGPDNSMDEAPGLHVVKVDPTNPDNQCYGTTDTGINIHAHYTKLLLQLERMLAIESALTEFATCLHGPSVIPPTGEEGELHSCVLHCDMDGDGDIDLFDFAVFQDEVDAVCEMEAAHE